MKIECGIFKSTVYWSDVIFYFPIDITFKEIKRNLSTSFLTKDEYIGSYEFDQNFLNILDNDTMYGKNFYFTYYIPN
jgi:hypothetical protein